MGREEGVSRESSRAQASTTMGEVGVTGRDRWARVEAGAGRDAEDVINSVVHRGKPCPQ